MPSLIDTALHKRGEENAKKHELLEFEIPPTGIDLDSVLADAERAYLSKALEMSGGIKHKAAELLGITFRSLRYRLEKLGLE